MPNYRQLPTRRSQLVAGREAVIKRNLQCPQELVSVLPYCPRTIALELRNVNRTQIYAPHLSSALPVQGWHLYDRTPSGS